jgi:hypothetical protein
MFKIFNKFENNNYIKILNNKDVKQLKIYKNI